MCERVCAWVCVYVCMCVCECFRAYVCCVCKREIHISWNDFFPTKGNAFGIFMWERSLIGYYDHRNSNISYSLSFFVEHFIFFCLTLMVLYHSSNVMCLFRNIIYSWPYVVHWFVLLFWIIFACSQNGQKWRVFSQKWPFFYESWSKIHIYRK